MEITIKNYKSKLPDDVIKKSLRCEVRECDEVNPGVFESYVDELDRSYDVSITIDKTLLVKHNCDCDSPASICHHKAALIAFIAKGSKPAAKIRTTKKVDPLQQALEDADPVKLREWVLKTLSKQKELGLAFLTEFSTVKKIYTPDEVVALTDDAVKAVINRRKKAETSEVKKIVELWSELHRPLIENFCAEPTNANYFAQLHAIVDTVYMYRYRIATNSKRFESYLKQVIDQITPVVSIIQDDESWNICIGYFASEVFMEMFRELRKDYVNLIINNFNSGSSARRALIVKHIMNIYLSRKQDNLADAMELSHLSLRMAFANQQFAEYKDWFRPVRHAYLYNLNIIDGLLELGDLKKAESICLDQIGQNTNSEYNSGYNARLRQIYGQTENRNGLASVIARELLKKPNFEDYLFVEEKSTDDEEFRKWRAQVLANARILARFDKTSADFSLALRHHEGNWKGLISYIDEYADYDSILLYGSESLDFLPALFLQKLTEKLDSYRDRTLSDDNPEKLDPILEDLYQLCVSKYGVEPLQKMVEQQVNRFRSWVNLFVAYAGRKLMGN